MTPELPIPRVRTPHLLALVCGALTIAFLFACIGMSVSLKFFKGEDRCGEVNLRSGWSYPGTDRNSMSTTTLFRAITNPQEAICVAKKVAFTYELSNERRCFEKGKGELFPITSEQWEAGTPIPGSEPYRGPADLPGTLRAGFRDDGFTYGGRTFERAGRYWVKMQEFAVRPSPSGKYIVMQSVDDDNDKHYWFFRDPDREPKSTNVYVQVFELASGEELLRARIRLRHIYADSSYAQTRWMDGDHLWIETFLYREKYSCAF